MANQLVEFMLKQAKADIEESPVKAWYNGLSQVDQRLLDDARQTRIRYGRGYELLLQEEKLRMKTVQERDARPRQ